MDWIVVSYSKCLCSVIYAVFNICSILYCPGLFPSAQVHAGVPGGERRKAVVPWVMLQVHLCHFCVSISPPPPPPPPTPSPPPPAATLLTKVHTRTARSCSSPSGSMSPTCSVLDLPVISGGGAIPPLLSLRLIDQSMLMVA
jgi:hypothetical protein